MASADQMADAAFFGNRPEEVGRVYGRGRRDRLARMCRLYPDTVTSATLDERLPALAEIEAVFSTWGMFLPSPEQFLRLPRLKAVFYAAGSVQGFARPFLERGITVVSGWGANAVPVAEFTLAQILLANKGYFRNVRDWANPATRAQAFRGNGNFDETVALLGAGMIGRKVVELLKPFRLRVLVFDPFLAPADAARMAVEKATLEEAFRGGTVVSNHIANLPETRGMIRAEHFESMRENAVFINTGRGETLDTEGLVRVLRSRPDLTALLDVVSTLTPQANAELSELPNVVSSGHIAGAIGDEVLRMADAMIEEFTAWRAGAPLRYAVTLDMLRTMA